MVRTATSRRPRGTPAPSRDVNWYEAGGLVALTLLIYLFWNTPVVYPLKILVVFFHEMSHGIAAWLTGGSVDSIQVNALEGGVCVTRGGSRFAILTAGYLGSLLWGGLILLWTARSRAHAVIPVILGGILLCVTIGFVRPIASFGFTFGLMTGLCLVLAGIRLSHRFNKQLLKIMGLTSCFYAMLDIIADTIVQPHRPSDAAMLSKLTGMPTLFWGGLWLMISATATVYFLRKTCQRKTGPS